MVECNIEVEDVAVEEDSLIRYAVADDFIRRGAD